MIWEQFGLRQSPYFWSELDVSEESAGLFVGREQESRHFAIGLADEGGCTFTVSGASGVGKTSFVNVNQYSLFTQTGEHSGVGAPVLLPAFKKVQLRPDDSIDGIYLKVLSCCVHSIERVCKWQSRDFPKDLCDLREYINQIVSYPSGQTVSVSAFGFGAGFGARGGATSSDSGRDREMTFSRYLDRVVDVVRAEFDVDGIAVVIDNLDIVPKQFLSEILDYLRDPFFGRKYLWWILLGGPGLHQFIRFNVPRLAGVVKGPPIELRPLLEAEFSLLLQTRLRVFSSEGREPQEPISRDIMAYLYEHSGGDIRFAFQVADEVVRRVFINYPSVTSISREQAATQIANITHEQFVNWQFDQYERPLLNFIFNNTNAILRPSDFGAYGLANVQECYAALERLVGRHLVQRDQLGGETVYVPVGYAALGQLLNNNTSNRFIRAE